MRCLKGCRRPVRKPASGPEVRDSRKGIALLETLIAATLLTIGIVNAVAAALKCSQLQQSTAAYSQAHSTSRDVLEQIRNGDLAVQFAAFAANPDFTVGNQTVSVRFPEAMLVEAFGVPVPATARFRDLDADGQVDIDAASEDTVGLLPVLITVTEGNLTLQLESLLSEI